MRRGGRYHRVLGAATAIALVAGCGLQAALHCTYEYALSRGKRLQLVPNPSSTTGAAVEQ